MVFHIIQLIIKRATFIFKKMIKSRDYERNVRSNYTKSLSNLLPYDIVALELKEFWLRKSFFQPDKGLAEIYAARNHIAGADVPTI